MDEVSTVGRCMHTCCGEGNGVGGATAAAATLDSEFRLERVTGARSSTCSTGPLLRRLAVEPDFLRVLVRTCGTLRAEDIVGGVGGVDVLLYGIAEM